MKYLILVFIYAQLAQAGGRIIGNGGDLILCKDKNDSILSVELLDFYESKIYRNLELQKSPIDWKSQLVNNISKLEKVSNDRYNLYMSWLDSFDEESQFLRDIQLSDIPDSGQIVIPKDCELKQAVNQVTVLLPGQKRYLFDLDLWENLDETNKAGLVLHEFIYREAIGLDHLDSIATRYLNGLIFSTLFVKLSSKEIIHIFKDLNFKSLVYQGAKLKLNDHLLFYDDNTVSEGEVIQGSEFHFKLSNQFFRIRDFIYFYPNGELKRTYLEDKTHIIVNEFDLNLDSQIIEFYPGEIFKLGVLSRVMKIEIGDLNLNLNGHIEFTNKGHLLKSRISNSFHDGIRISDFVEFYDSGELKSLRYSENKNVFILGMPATISGQTDFYENGLIKKLFLVAKAKLKTQKKIIKTFNAFEIIELDEFGRVIE